MNASQVSWSPANFRLVPFTAPISAGPVKAVGAA
jgi:hypothetical protein